MNLNIFKNKLFYITILIVIVFLILIFVFFIFRQTYIDSGMVSMIRIVDGDKQLNIDPSTQIGHKILEKSSDILSHVIQVRMVFVGDEIYEARNSSSYVEIILNGRYRFKTYDREVETDKIIIFLSGEEEHIVTTFGGIDEHGQEVWNCYSISPKHASFIELKGIVKDLMESYR